MTSIEWLVFAMLMSAKALLILASALVLTRLMRDRSAAERHLVWVVASACVLALPALSLAGPAWRIGVPAPWMHSHARGAASPSEAAPLPAVAPVAASQAVVAGRAGAARVVDVSVSRAVRRENTARVRGTTVIAAPAAVIAPPAPAVGSAAPREEPDEALMSGIVPSRALLSKVGVLMLTVWLAGTVLMLVRVMAGYAGIRRVVRSARPLSDPALLLRAHGTAEEIGVNRTLRVLEGDALAMPITFGVLSPTLLLPSAAREWPRTRQEAVLRHELEHVRRRDTLSQLIAELACALYWFNPLMWNAARRMRIEREHACDDAVLASGSRPTDYATDLLEIARTLKYNRATEAAAIAMAKTSHLSERVASLLDAGRRRERTSTRLLVPAWLGASLLIIPVSSLVVELRAPGGAASGSPIAETVAAAPADLPARAPDVIASSPGQHGREPLMAGALPSWRSVQDCLSSGRDSHINSNANNGRRTIKWSGDGCSGEVSIEGELQFDPAFTTITGISRGGRARITTAEAGVERSVTITRAGSGVEHEYRVDGDRSAFDDTGRQWLSSTLLFMFRRLGFMADERAAAIVQRGGPDALLAEVDVLPSDHTRSTYLRVLIERGGLDAATLDRVLSIAGSTIDSDHYRTAIITAVAGRYEFTDAVRDSYIRAVSGIDSDHYMHEAFSHLLENGRLTQSQVAAVLGETGRIGSDHYRSELLRDLAVRYRSSDAIRPAYLAAAADIESDHYKTAVLMELLSLGDMSSSDLAEVVDAAATIDSDHYRSDVLEHVARNGLTDAAIRRAFVRAAQGMESDHYLQTVLSRFAGRDGLSQAELVALLDAAAGIDSDRYRSELLISVARRHRLEGEARTRFEQLMNAIGSRTRRDAVADALRNGTA